jgi:hypothetical protein
MYTGTRIGLGYFLLLVCASCGVVEESYPAVQALSQIGPPAATAALKEISHGKKELRVQLLCRVLLNVEGREKTTKLLEDAIAQPKDVGQRKRLSAALKQNVQGDQ